MNVDAGYSQAKTPERIRYEENVHDADKYQDAIRDMMIKCRKHESFSVDINNDSEIQYAFTQVLRYIRKHRDNNIKPMVFGYDLNNHSKVFSLNKESDTEAMIKSILGEVTVEIISSNYCSY